MRNVLALCALLLVACETRIRDVVDGYGYTEVVPPSRLYEPGAIIAIVQSDPLIVHTVCRAEQNFGRKVEPVTSPTATRELQKKLDRTLGASADWIQQIIGSLSLTSVRDIKISVANARVREIDYATFYQHRYGRDSACQYAVTQTANTTAIISVFVADITYTITWKSGITAEVKATDAGKLRAKLGADATNSGTDIIVGSELVWGLRDNTKLVNTREETARTVAVIEDTPLLAGESVLYKES